MPTFTNAIVRPPGKTFAHGLTSSGLGAPVYEKAIEQHGAYCKTLARCGLQVTVLEQSPDFPDSTFVEDVAVLTPRGGIITRPGAASRLNEVDLIRPALREHFSALHEISAPGTLDGGDVCEAGDHYYIGLSRRTNQEGARQLAGWLSSIGYTSSIVDIRGLDGILHLKSGIAHIGDDTVVAIEELAEPLALRRHRIVRVSRLETYAANCIRVNDRVLVAAGFPQVADALGRLKYAVDPIDVSEFQKMDGGLSCLSLRF